MLPKAYLDVPSVRANLVQGLQSVFVDVSGSSRGISNELDRQRLLELRELADVVVTDGATARLENYRVPKCADLAVITRTGYEPARGASNHTYVDIAGLAPAAGIRRLQELGYKRVLLEVGPNILRELIADGLVDELCLTNTSGSAANLDPLNIGLARCVFTEQSSDTTFTLWREIQA